MQIKLFAVVVCQNEETDFIKVLQTTDERYPEEEELAFGNFSLV